MIADFWKTFQRSYSSETDHLLSLAQDAVDGRIKLFGWKKVPVSVPALEPQDAEALEVVKGWDSTNYWDINFFHSKARPDFDVKWLWELQRLQFLLWLGAAWRLTGDNRFASVAREILDWWFDHLRYPWGVEWSSNLEVGLRLLSISRCHIMFMNSPEVGFEIHIDTCGMESSSRDSSARRNHPSLHSGKSPTGRGFGPGVCSL